MRKIHGYEILGEFRRNGAESVILAFENRENGTEYVTGIVGTELLNNGEAREWYWGHYFWNDRDAAIADFIARADIGRFN